MPSLTVLTHINLFYLKFYSLRVYAVQITGVCNFLSWSNCLISSKLMQAGWMPTGINLGTSDYLLFKTFTVLLNLMCGTLAWDSSNNLHFEQDAVIASNLRSTSLDSQIYLSPQPRWKLWSKIVSPFLCLYCVKGASKHKNLTIGLKIISHFSQGFPQLWEMQSFFNAFVSMRYSFMSIARWFIPYDSVDKKIHTCYLSWSSTECKSCIKEKSMLQEW